MASEGEETTTEATSEVPSTVPESPQENVSQEPTAQDYGMDMYLDESESEEEQEAEEEEVLELTEEDLGNLSLEEFEDLFQKNTASFRCLAQVLISRSSLLRSALYWFPPLEDPGIEEAFCFEEAEPFFDDGVGTNKYISLCKEMGIVPISRVVKFLSTNELNLKYYGLTNKQIKAICSALLINRHVQKLNLQDNWLTAEMVEELASMLQENGNITYLNLRECRIGPDGAAKLKDGLLTSQSIKELDLSFNSIGDTGLKAIAQGIRENGSIKLLNLSHNKLGEDSSKNMQRLIGENTTIENLDLSWNDYYTETGMKNLCEGLKKNQTIKVLNLAWNGIETKEATIPLLKYLKETEALEELHLNNNRLNDVSLRIARAGAAKCSSLKKLHIGNNIITPDEAQFIAQILTNEPDSQLEHIDMENAFVKKSFLQLKRRFEKLGKSVKIEGVLSNYKIYGPEVNKLLFARCKFLAMKAKKKKAQKDFGHFLYSLPEEPINKTDFMDALKKFKLKKLDKDLVEAVVKAFPAAGGRVNCLEMRNSYLKYYPETARPEKKAKKKKKGKKKKKDKGGKKEKEEKKDGDKKGDKKGKKAKKEQPVQEKHEEISASKQALLDSGLDEAEAALLLPKVSKHSAPDVVRGSKEILEVKEEILESGETKPAVEGRVSVVVIETKASVLGSKTTLEVKTSMTENKPGSKDNVEVSGDVPEQNFPVENQEFPAEGQEIPTEVQEENT